MLWGRGAGGAGAGVDSVLSLLGHCLFLRQALLCPLFGALLLLISCLVLSLHSALWFSVKSADRAFPSYLTPLSPGLFSPLQAVLYFITLYLVVYCVFCLVVYCLSSTLSHRCKNVALRAGFPYALLFSSWPG